MSASACWRCTCVRCEAICCCWCASVCFMSTILMLCSMAYFLARDTASDCSELSRGSDPPRMAGSKEHFAPGPAPQSELVSGSPGRRKMRRRLFTTSTKLHKEELTGVNVSALVQVVDGRREEVTCKAREGQRERGASAGLQGALALPLARRARRSAPRLAPASHAPRTRLAPRSRIGHSKVEHIHTHSSGDDVE